MLLEHVIRRLFASETVTFFDFRCSCHDTATGGEERSTAHSIAFPRTGLFVKHAGRRPIVGDANQVLFFNANEPYRVSHPVGGGDTCTVLELAPDALQEMLALVDPAAKDRPEKPFQFGSCASDPGVHWGQRALTSRLLGNGCSAPADVLATEESLLALAYRALRGAYSLHGGGEGRRRAGTSRVHRALSDDAQVLLGRCYAEKLDLGRIARAVHSSPFHLSRVFRREVGLPIHRYLNRLRLRACLERLSDGCGDLTTLALETGFHSHAHLTEAFRKEFGTTPSAARAGFGDVRDGRNSVQSGAVVI